MLSPLCGMRWRWVHIRRRGRLSNLLTDKQPRIFSPSLPSSLSLSLSLIIFFFKNGGLFYPRNDQATDSEGCWTHMDPFSENAAIGYARLNVEDGQKKMWERPWTKEYLQTQPWVDGLHFNQGVDCLRGVWDEQVQAMIITVREWAGKATSLGFSVHGLPSGTWTVYRGKCRESTKHEVPAGEKGVVLVKETLAAGEEVDFVIMRDVWEHTAWRTSNHQLIQINRNDTLLDCILG